MADKIRVGVMGAAGRMGRETCRAISSVSDLELVWAYDIQNVGQPVPHTNTVLRNEFSNGTALESAQVLVDFTHPHAALEHALRAMRAGVAPIIGTSGLAGDDLKTLAQVSDETGVPAMMVPNFAIGAVLMMQFAAQAARWMPECEIIELHHERKVDAPSKTAERTAELIAEARSSEVVRRETLELHPGARGADVHGVTIHSVRLPGKLAHQMVIFGSVGENLTIQHDSTDRASFMPGVLLSIRQILSRRGLTIGLDELLKR